MLDPFFLKKAATALVLPPTGPLVLALAGVMLLRRVPRLGRAAILAGILALLVFSLPVVSTGLLRILDDSPALDLSRPVNAQAIVVLGGGIRRDAQEYGGDTVGRLSLERVRYGARVAKSTGLPVLVTGGVVHEGEPEAVVMQRVLQDEFGVAVRWTETASRNTRENARYSADELAKAGIRRIILVAHSFDMRRAKAEFADVGLEVVPAPTGVPNAAWSGARDLVPSVPALQGSYWALYELLASAVR